MPAVFKLHHKIKNFVIDPSNNILPNWAKKTFGQIDSWMIRMLYASQLSPTPVSPFHYIATMIKPGNIYIDIGAALGQMVTVAHAAVGKTGRIYAIEPQEVFYNRLCHLKNIFGWTNVNISRTLIGDRIGEHTFYENPNPRRSSVFADWEGGTPAVYPMVTLDDWARTNHVSKADLIKIDVEGAELKVIQGGYHFLAQTKPIIIMEIKNHPYRLNQLGYSVDHIIAQLRNIGYREFYALRAEGLVPIRSYEDITDTDIDMLARART